MIRPGEKAFAAGWGMLLWVVLAGTALGQTSTFTGTGNWSDPARWNNGVPGSGTAATIANGATCTVDISAVAASVTIASGANNTTLTISGTNSLSVGGAVTINAPTANNINKTIDVGAGSLDAASITMATTTANSRDCILSISTGTAAIGGNITMNGIAARNHIDWTGNGTLSVGGNMTGGGLTVGTNGTVLYNGAGAQTAGGAYIYDNLTVNSGGAVSIGGNTTVNGDLTVTSGTLGFGAFTTSVVGATSISGTLSMTSVTGTKTFAGSVTINSGGTWDNSAGESIILQGGLTHDGTTFTSGTGTYTFNTNSQVIGGLNPIAFSGIVAITGAITLTNNTAVTISGNLTGSVAGSTWLNSAGSTLELGAATLVTGTLDASANPNTVRYVSTTAAQTVKAATYHHLEIDKSAQTATISGATTIGGNLTVTSGTLILTGATTVTGNVAVTSGTLNPRGINFSVGGSTSVSGTLSFTTSATGTKTFAGPVTINSGGSWTNAINEGITFQGGLTHDGATFTSGTGIYLFDTNNQAIGGGSTIAITNMTVTGVTLTNTGTLSVSTSLTGTGEFTNGAGATLSIGATVANFSVTTLTAAATGNTVDYSAAGAQTVRGIDYYDLTISGVRGANSVTFANGGTVGIAGALTLSAAFTTGGYIMTNNTVHYNGSAAQAITAFTYFHLTVSGGAAKTAAGAVTVNGNFNNSTTTSMVTFTLSIVGTRTNSGTMQFAGETNGLVFSDGTVDYNGTSAQAPAGQTVAVGTYANLVFSNDATRRVFGGTVHTQSSLTVGSSGPLSVESDGILQVDGDIDNQGSIINTGIITVGI